MLTACAPALGEGGPVDDLGNGGAGGGSNLGPLTPAVAMTRARQQQLEKEYRDQQSSGPSVVSSSATGGGQDTPDPTDLVIALSDLGESCNFDLIGMPCGGHWHLQFALPIAYQQVGVYALKDRALKTTFWESGEPNSPALDDCPKGFGTFSEPGTIEVLAIDSVEVRFRVTVDDLFLGSNPSGEYTAPRCP
ncbi:hypothetical protein WMF30_18485 [Sorangium sp. So ce134]